VHIEGDYKTPPPDGKYDAWHEHAHSLMQRHAVTLSPEARQAALAVMLHAWVQVHKIEVLALSVSGQHFHVLARFGGLPNEQAPPDPTLDTQKPTALRRGLRGGKSTLRTTDPARFYVGIAKERSAKALAAAHFVTPGRVWAKRGKIVPISDREHQVRVMNYIIEHASEGAVVWSFRMPLPTLPDVLPPTKKPTA
jgi:hypothetical protein